MFRPTFPRFPMPAPIQSAASDAAIMRAVQQGQTERFALLVERYERPLRRVAWSRIGNLELAEDLVQEAFLAAFKSRHTFKPDANFRTWIWTILLNLCRRHFTRQGHREAQVPWSQLGPEDAAPEPQAPPTLPGWENTELLETLLASLPETQADALRLRFFGQLTFQEIAETMSCSLGTAKNRVKAGLTQLAAALREQSEGRPGQAGHQGQIRTVPRDLS